MVNESLVLLFLIFAAAGADDWSYSYGDHLGPGRWAAKYEQCAGQSQSPIAIWPNDLDIKTYSDKKDGIQLHNYDTAIKNATMINNGQTVVISVPPDPDSQPRFTAGHLPNKYKLAQLHFHWGQGDNVGSEHTIGHSTYPLELHLVHANEDTDQPEAVIGVFFQLIDNHSPFANPQMESISKQLHKVPRAQTITFLPDYLRVSELLSPNKDNYIYYNGSLTTPPCTEGIQWTILTQVQNVTQLQLDQFRHLRKNEGLSPGNYRPTQPLNGRRVTWYTYQASHKTSQASRRSVSPITLIIPFVFMIPFSSKAS